MINRNSELSEILRDTFKSQQNIDGTISQVSNQVVPVAEVNPTLVKPCNVVLGGTKSNSGASTVYTTPTSRDFYLNSLVFSITKDAACDMATGGAAATVVIEGVTQSIVLVPVITLTASDKQVNISFPKPIKLDRGSIIGIGGQTFAAGVCVRTLSFTGFTLDNPRA